MNLLRHKDPLRESHDDEGDVVYISSTAGSRTDHTDPEAEDDSETDDNANRVINPVQLHLSYEDSQDVEIYHIEDNRVRWRKNFSTPGFKTFDISAPDNLNFII